MTNPIVDTAVSPVVSPAPEPYGAAVLDEVRRFLQRFVVFPDQAAVDVVTLWVAHTHAVDADRTLVFDSTPRIALLSKDPGSGKTRALELMELLSGRGQRVTDPTAPSLTGLINDEKATLLIDEIDMLFGRGSGQRPIRALLNSGYRRGAVVARRREMVDAFAPVAMAGLGSNFQSNPALRPLYTRTIIVWMRPRKTGEEIDEWRDRAHRPQADNLRRMLAGWARANALGLSTAWPVMPDGVRDRLADVWEPLLSVADVAGGHWPESARRACAQMALGDAEEDPEVPPSQRILADLKTVFFDAAALPTATIIERLYEVPASPWRTIWPDQAAAPRELAALLRPYGVGVTKIWNADESRPLQGYKRADLEKVWPEDDQAPELEPSGLPDLPATE
jgi:hypothetical protein